MPCCQVPAVPKTSPLGNFFFAHARRGECKTAPESAEHIFCKALIARAAQNAGWEVTTERQGVSPAGEVWVADVFCEKGSAQLALEVQLSQQPLEETIRRQERYKASGVRAAWFYGPKLGKDFAAASKSTPIFGLSDVKVGQESLVGRADIPLTEFVGALLSKRVTWVRPGYTEPFYIVVLQRTCSNCKRPAGLAYGHAHTQSGLPPVPLTPDTVGAALGRLFNAITYAELESLGLCHIVRVHQGRQRGVTYMNGCQHCHVGVENSRLCTWVTDEANGPTQLSGLECLYFDRNARDSGSWAFITEDGEFQALTPTFS